MGVNKLKMKNEKLKVITKKHTNNRRYTVGTLGSHSALQILKGAKDESFHTIVVVTEKNKKFYSRFGFIDEVFSIRDYKDFVQLEPVLRRKNVIIIPHGSFVAYLGENENKNMTVAYFGNKAVLDWESDRFKQREWLKKSGINVPKQFFSIDDNIKFPIIVKTYGAAGGKGYFYAKNKKDFHSKIERLGDSKFVIQEYIIGVPLYIHYFYSPLTDSIEITSIDRRYETNVDSLGRIPLAGQEGLHIDPSYVVVGNSPLTLRESLLPEAYDMGERLVEASKKLIKPRGLFGPFCIETVITPDQQFFVIEISCRIVAGTNLYIEGSPYSWFHYDEPMSTGRRIAREIRNAIKEDRLEEVLD